MVGHIDREVYRPLFPFPIIRPRIDNYTGWDGDRDKAAAAKAVSEYGVALEVYIDMRIPRGSAASATTLPSTSASTAALHLLTSIY